LEQARKGPFPELMAEERGTATTSVTLMKGGFHPPSVSPQLSQSILPLGPLVVVVWLVAPMLPQLDLTLISPPLLLDFGGLESGLGEESGLSPVGLGLGDVVVEVVVGTAAPLLRPVGRALHLFLLTDLPTSVGERAEILE